MNNSKNALKFFMVMLVISIFYSCGSSETQIQRNNESYINSTTFKSDYFTTVNKDWLLENLDYPQNTSTIQNLNDEKMVIKLDQLLSQTKNENPQYNKLVSAYKLGLDIEQRNELALSPVQKYIDAYKASRTVEDLLLADIYLDLYLQERASQRLHTYRCRWHIQFPCAKALSSFFGLRLHNLPNTWQDG